MTNILGHPLLLRTIQSDHKKNQRILVLGPGVFKKGTLQTLQNHESAPKIPFKVPHDFSPQIFELCFAAPELANLVVVDQNSGVLEAVKNPMDDIPAYPRDLLGLALAPKFEALQTKIQCHKQKLNWTKKSFDRLPSPPEGFDYIIATHVFEHLFTPVIQAGKKMESPFYQEELEKVTLNILDSLVDRLKVGGKLFINPTDFKYILLQKTTQSAIDHLKAVALRHSAVQISGDVNQLIILTKIS